MSAGVTPTADSLAAQVRERVPHHVEGSFAAEGIEWGVHADDCPGCAIEEPLDVLMQRLAVAEQERDDAQRDRGEYIDIAEGLEARAAAAEQDNERLREGAENLSREYNDVFGQLLRRHGDVHRAEARVTELERELRDATRMLAAAVWIGGANGKLTLAASTLREDFALEREDSYEGHVTFRAEMVKFRARPPQCEGCGHDEHDPGYCVMLIEADEGLRPCVCTRARAVLGSRPHQEPPA